MELEEKVLPLENAVVIIKTTIKVILVELKELMRQDHNRLAAPRASDQRTVDDRPVIVATS